ncbi:MAG: UDP-N-acetylmuramate--L-alanine ligase [Candidatus Latescibacterota bacterium]|nr:MAG: UDP-N-acetylmuramate--L-alanine ligase [Candidatus Latescibacterota bacterium]
MVYLGRTKRIHFVGIGGIGMSGIAEVLLNLGFDVSGSDLKRTEITENLEKLGARISYGHESENVHDSDVVVYSSAVNKTNPELVEAKKNAVPTIPRTEMLAELMRLKFAVTVAGSHGKTTTTSLISSVLAEGGLDPTIVVGGKLRALSSNVRLGDSRYLVAEADESDGKFVQLPSSIAVITNIDREHLDFYPDLEAIKDGFVEYASRVPFYGTVILCVDDPNIRSIMPRIRKRKLTYAIDEPADLRGRVTKRDEMGCLFTVLDHDRELGEVRVGFPGDHYVQNTLAAVAVGMELDVPFEIIKRGIESFEGVGRRFEVKGETRGVMVVDDYGHHPTEIAATIRAARENLGKRVFVLFQPHRYTRTQALAEQFGVCFDGAHAVFVTDIYPAGEEPIPGVSTDLLLETIKTHGNIEVFYSKSFEMMIDEVLRRVEDGDLVLTLGAGDIFRAGELLLDRLEKEK